MTLDPQNWPRLLQSARQVPVSLPGTAVYIPPPTRAPGTAMTGDVSFYPEEEPLTLPEEPGVAAPGTVPAAPPGGSPPDTQRQQLSLETMQKMGQMPMPSAAPPPQSHIHCMTIIGQVEGHMVLPPKNKTTKYEHLLPQLVAVEEHPQIKGLLLILNTVGGDIEAGLAIAELIKSMSKPTVSLVLGGGHSIGVPIAVAARYSFIAETATMTIHPIRMTGMVVGIPQTYEYLDKMQDRVIKFVCANSRISEEKFRELMLRTGDLVRDVGSVLIGKEAVEVGIINEVGGLAQALGKLDALIAEQDSRSRPQPQAQPGTVSTAGRPGGQPPVPPSPGMPPAEVTRPGLQGPGVQ